MPSAPFLAPCLSVHGAEIPVIGLGTWPLRDAECADAVATALAAGYRHVDTAAMYGNEAAVGDGIRRSGIARDEIFIVTKVAPADLGPGDFERSVEASLAALKLDAVDLLLIHWPSRTLPVAETIGRLNDCRRRGLARHIGVSNFTTALLDAAWASTDAPLVVNQCEYHPYLAQDAVIAATRARGMGFVSYSPLGRRAALDEPAIQDIAATHGRSPAQIVLRWQVQQPGVVAIPKSGTPARIRQNIDIFGFELAAEEMAAISALAAPDSRLVDIESMAPEWD